MHKAAAQSGTGVAGAPDSAGRRAAGQRREESVMFARVITAEAGPDGFDGFISLAREQLPGAREQPGFKAYYLLTDAGTGKLMVISLWETREQMEAVAAGAGASGIRDEGVPATALTSLNLETYEVALQD